jgi:HSP20 family protein
VGVRDALSVVIQERDMSFIKIRITKDLGNIETELRKSIDEMFRLVSPRFKPCERLWAPQIDIYEAPAEIVVIIDVAGVKREHIHVEIGRRTLKISGVRRENPITKQARYRLAEIPYGYFERTLSLPAQVDADCATATYTDGFLYISIAKLPLDRVHKIPIEND